MEVVASAAKPKANRRVARTGYFPSSAGNRKSTVTIARAVHGAGQVACRRAVLPASPRVSRSFPASRRVQALQRENEGQADAPISTASQAPTAGDSPVCWPPQTPRDPTSRGSSARISRPPGSPPRMKIRNGCGLGVDTAAKERRDGYDARPVPRAETPARASFLRRRIHSKAIATTTIGMTTCAQALVSRILCSKLLC